MNRTLKNTILSLLLIIQINCISQSSNVIEKVVAVVGSNIISKSQLESQYLQMESKADKKNSGNAHIDKCVLLNQLLFQKLLVAQAIKDSVDVTEAQVENELDRRMRYFLGQFGSEKRFTEFYGKTPEDFKNDLRDDVKDLMRAQKVQAKITEGMTVSPSEVRAYFNRIPKDSLPYINEEVEIGEIIKKPIVSKTAKAEAKAKLQALYDRIKNGEDFRAMATLYSDDPGSAIHGGDYDSLRHGQFVPEFEAVAFKLKVNEVSPVFETSYGYHIVKLRAKHGELIDVSHILIAPKTSQDDIIGSKLLLDSLYNLITKDSIKFTDAASKFTDDEDEKIEGGKMVNPQTGATKFEKSDLGLIDPTLSFTIDKMVVGEITKPTVTTLKDGKQVYRVICLISRSEPHVANLKDDYQKIQAAALREKQQKEVNNWIRKKLPGIYIRIDDEYRNCTFDVNWLLNSK